MPGSCVCRAPVCRLRIHGNPPYADKRHADRQRQSDLRLHRRCKAAGASRAFARTLAWRRIGEPQRATAGTRGYRRPGAGRWLRFDRGRRECAGEDARRSGELHPVRATGGLRHRARHQQVTDWYREYFKALAVLGWAQTTQQFEEYKSKTDNLEVHKSIISLLGALLGPKAAAVVMVAKTLDALQ